MNDLFLKTRVIALTGGIATGKTTVARFLSSQGWSVIDADRLAREVLAPKSEGLGQVVTLFGKDILNSDGELNRGKLGAIVFTNKELRKKLEEITHPLIRKSLLIECRSFAEKHPTTIFYEATLIFETATQSHFKEVWVTACSPEAQILRLMARNHWDKTQAQTVISSQMPLGEKIKQAHHVIWTDSPPEIYLPELLQYLKDRRF